MQSTICLALFYSTQQSPKERKKTKIKQVPYHQRPRKEEKERRRYTRSRSYITKDKEDRKEI